jgi:hypothetical protein
VQHERTSLVVRLGASQLSQKGCLRVQRKGRGLEQEAPQNQEPSRNLETMAWRGDLLLILPATIRLSADTLCRDDDLKMLADRPFSKSGSLLESQTMGRGFFLHQGLGRLWATSPESETKVAICAE